MGKVYEVYLSANGDDGDKFPHLFLHFHIHNRNFPNNNDANNKVDNTMVNHNSNNNHHNIRVLDNSNKEDNIERMLWVVVLRIYLF